MYLRVVLAVSSTFSSQIREVRNQIVPMGVVLSMPTTTREFDTWPKRNGLAPYRHFGQCSLSLVGGSQQDE